jgi:glycosyltransferase involved in cell wall biosynthesis
MHICFLCNEYPPSAHGGIGAFTQTLGRKLVEQGHQVTVLGCYKRPHAVVDDDGGVSVHRQAATRLPWTGFWLNGRQLRRELRAIHAQRSIDLVDAPENAFALLPLHTMAGKIIRMHGGHHFFYTCLGKRPRVWRSWLEKRSFARADFLCGVSRFVAEETRRLLSLGNAPIEILPNPVDMAKFRPMPEVPVIPGRIVFVGTLCEKKGIRQLVQAMPEILAAVPHAHLVACGRDYPDQATGRSFKELLESIISPAVCSRIVFKDHVNNEHLPQELASAEILVYPSHMEAQGIVIVEGMAMGRPVVATQTGPGPELIEPGISGLLCNPHDPRSIAESVIQVLKDRNLANQLGTAARNRAVAEFSLEKLVVKNENFYRRCIEARLHE